MIKMSMNQIIHFSLFYFRSIYPGIFWPFLCSSFLILLFILACHSGSRRKEIIQQDWMGVRQDVTVPWLLLPPKWKKYYSLVAGNHSSLNTKKLSENCPNDGIFSKNFQVESKKIEKIPSQWKFSIFTSSMQNPVLAWHSISDFMKFWKKIPIISSLRNPRAKILHTKDI